MLSALLFLSQGVAPDRRLSHQTLGRLGCDTDGRALLASHSLAGVQTDLRLGSVGLTDIKKRLGHVLTQLSLSLLCSTYIKGINLNLWRLTLIV